MPPSGVTPMPPFESDSVLVDERIGLSRNRRAIVKLMSESAAVPQFTVEASVDLTALTARRSTSTEPFSIGDAVTRATALALLEHPSLNASFDGDAIVRHGTIDIGLGILGPEGLMVVVLRGTDRLALDALATERRRLQAAAAAGTLRGEDVIGSTFVVSNLGPAGVVRFQALVVPPAACTLAVGAVVQGVRLRSRQAEEYPSLNLCLSCDHRVLDGMEAARFLHTVTELLEQAERIAAWT
jgi:pyruvate dehydrogenase E2 component (dihydrolipoamide acetyltransferase)